MSEMLASSPAFKATQPNSYYNSNLPDICSINSSVKNLSPSKANSSENIIHKYFNDSLTNEPDNIEDVLIKIKPTKNWKVISMNIVVPKKKRKLNEGITDENENTSSSYKCSFANEVLQAVVDQTCSSLNASVSGMSEDSLENNTNNLRNGSSLREEEKIVHELVISKFNETLEKYRNRSIKRQLNRLRNTVIGHFNNVVSDKLKNENVFSQGMLIKESSYENQSTNTIHDSKRDLADVLLQNELVLEALRDERLEDADSNLSKQCTYDSRGCTTEFQDLSYDSQEFLRSALGEELANYTTNESLSVGNLYITIPTVEESIGTSNLSELISRDSIYRSTSNKHFIRQNSRTTYDYPVEEIRISETDKQQQQEQNQKLDGLMELSLVHYQTMVQASKAAQLCESSKEFFSSFEHIEAERLLLLSTHRRNAIVEEIGNINYTDIEDNTSFGRVFLSNLFFPGKKAEPNRQFTKWFVCIISCGTNVFATKAVRGDSDGNVVFEDEFEFKPLTSDFEIDVSLFGIRLKNSMRNYSHESRFHLNKKSKGLCLNPKNFFAHRTSRSTLPVSSTCTSSFILYGKAVVRINDLKRTDFHMCNLSPLIHPLYGTFRASFNSLIILPVSFSGFLNVGKETSSGIAWNRLWCLLEGKLIKCFRYPNDAEECRNPVEVLALDCCASDVVKAADRSICARPRTLLLEVFEEKDLRIVLVSRFLSADSVSEVKTWEKKINSVISALKEWNCMKEMYTNQLYAC